MRHLRLRLSSDCGDSDDDCNTNYLEFIEAKTERRPHETISLALNYEGGWCLPVDLEKAAALLTENADQNEPVGQILLGDAYLHGRGVTQDTARARELFAAASKTLKASSSTPYWQAAFVFAYRGVPDLFLEAGNWPKPSAEIAFDSQFKNMDRCQTTPVAIVIYNYSNSLFWPGYIGEQFTNGECVYRNEKLAFQIFLESALRHNPFAEVSLARAYLIGMGVTRDALLAQHWFDQAALRLISTFSRDKPEDIRDFFWTVYEEEPLPVEAVAAFDRAEKLWAGPADDLLALALEYRDGKIRAKDEKFALTLLRQAADHGHGQAMFELFRLQLKTATTEDEMSSAFTSLHRAAVADNLPAQLEAARRNAVGDLVRQSDYWAYQWYLIAEQNGANVKIELETLAKRLNSAERYAGIVSVRDWDYYPVIGDLN